MFSSLFRNLILLAIASIFSVCIAEMILRVTADGRPWKRKFEGKGALIQSSPTVYDAAIGVRFKPNWVGRYYYAGDDRFTLLRINSFGFRFPEYSAEKPPSMFRVALLGDSLVAALQVESDSHFRTLLEGAINSQRPAEVLNFAIPGTGPVAHLNAYRKYASSFSPDVVIFGITTQNDFTDDFAIDWKRANGDLISEPFRGAPGNLGKFLKTNSSLVMALWSLTLKKSYAKAYEEQVPVLPEDLKSRGNVALSGAESWQLAEVTKQNFEKTLEIWDTILASTEKDSAKVIVIMTPNEPRYTPQERWTDSPEKIVLHERLAEHFRREGASVITGMDILERHQSRYGSVSFCKWMGYLSEAGHKSFASLLADRMASLGFLDNRSK